MTNRLLAGFIIVLTGVYAFATARLPSFEISDPLGPKAFPFLVAILGIIAGVWLLVESRDQGKENAEEAKAADPHRHHMLAVCAVLGWLILYYLVFEELGFILAGIAFLLGLMFYFNRDRWTMNLMVSALFPLGVYFAFGQILGIPLPRGILPF